MIFYECVANKVNFYFSIIYVTYKDQNCCFKVHTFYTKILAIFYTQKLSVPIYNKCFYKTQNKKNPFFFP